MSMIRSIIFIFLIKACSHSSCEENPIVKTPLGSIRGTVETSRSGVDFYSFRRIPYAKSPMEDLLFQPPKPVESWTETLDATEDGPVCFMPITEYFKDCLRLNVYTRRIKEEEHRPVLVYIHGGHFNYLTARSDYYGPEYLMDHDIVVVTINYRLGALGFYSTGDAHAPGNYGMKDQVQALKWIKSNIRYFGGDPNKVTISGENAGAASVGLHLVSPMSRGLFHGAIMLSGSAINFGVIDRNPLELTKKLAKSLKCSTENTQQLSECITRMSKEEIEFIYNNFFPSQFIGKMFSPVIEPKIDKKERFLEKDPLDSLLEGDIADVPVFIGSAYIEKVSAVREILSTPEWANSDFSTNWAKIAPALSLYPPNDTVSQNLREFYFKKPELSTKDEDFKKGLAELLSDSQVIFGVTRFAKLLSRKNTTPVYLYRYNYDGKGLYKPRFRQNIPHSISNSVDIYYIFPSEIFFQKLNTTDEDDKFITKFTTLWRNFIETGNPTPRATAELDNVIWEPYTNERPKYLNINETLKLENGLYLEERMVLWETLFPLPEKN